MSEAALNKVIALPVQVGSVTVHVAKGRRWSVVEHLLLEAVAQNGSTAANLATAANLPLRMVIEALINLMRAGWLELQASPQGNLFAATAGGRALVGRDELPVSTRLVKRPVRYAVDRLSGSVLRYRELDFMWTKRFRQVEPEVDAIIKPAANIAEARQLDLIQALLDEDEEYRGLVPSSARAGDGYALVRVIDGKVRGLASASTQLKERIVEAAAKAPGRRTEVTVSGLRRPGLQFPKRAVAISADDLVIGGDEHRALLRKIITSANAWITIHSTFVGGGNSAEIFDLVATAARERGVLVDIFWGKSDRPDTFNDTRAASAAINERMKREGLQQFVRAHPFPTDSHAKFIVADDGRGAFVAVLGSCNWLSSNFDSFELSTRTSDALLVSDVMEACAQMVTTATGLNGGIATTLAGQAINIRKMNAERSGRRGEAQIVLGPQHAELVLKARDQAEQSIVIGSHRFGRSADALSLTPTRAKLDAHGIDATVYYGRLSDGLTPTQAAELRITHNQAGMRIRQIVDPRMHAKFLAWDDDNVVITSHNLLSADPSNDFAELGIHMRGNGIARRLREKLLVTFRT